ncbi:hypothetical protein DERF_014573 [Dermatophagoides farinae]|uniref:Uncharacterized protein n=1 Tax=Dermatophagoides farinae TaxID=6954 RepID=A0A922HMM5_DERFA|nr:hypothetical protein DERF_014545 [Dermatophagoides farinae]KAH9493845.1 hypothetical protein DERF_014573 [Dermatophagoides farinae]
MACPLFVIFNKTVVSGLVIVPRIPSIRSWKKSGGAKAKMLISSSENLLILESPKSRLANASDNELKNRKIYNKEIYNQMFIYSH